MESPGKFLKRERETRSISLEQISNFTKIKEHHLKAIEEDKYELLPPALYVKGFLTGYARYLALDPRDIVLQYEEYLKSLIPPEPVELQPVAPPRKRARQWFLLSLVFIGIFSTAFFILYQALRPAEKKSPIASFSLTSPPLDIQSEANARPVYPTQQNPLPESEKAEADVTKQPISAGFNVLEAGIGTGVERDGVQQCLIGKCSAFKSNNQRGYFFTRIKTQKEGKIAHIWLREGKECYRKEIDVKPPAWSVYSYFTFRPQHAGNWKAEARDGDRILTSLNFNVVQPVEDRSL
jgi:hypothetical protein